MKVRSLRDNTWAEVSYSILKEIEFKAVTKTKYFFDWKKEKEFLVYKLSLNKTGEILGLVSFEKVPDEWRYHIRLLTVSSENKGSTKMYDGIAGCLLASVAKQAVIEFGELACISLRPKSQIVQHYIQKYRMAITGATLSLEVPQIFELIEEYDNE